MCETCAAREIRQHTHTRSTTRISDPKVKRRATNDVERSAALAKANALGTHTNNNNILERVHIAIYFYTLTCVAVYSRYANRLNPRVKRQRRDDVCAAGGWIYVFFSSRLLFRSSV